MLEVESWTRAGEIGRARERLKVLQTDVERLGTLDAALLRQIEKAISGAAPNLKRVSELRQRAERHLVERAAELPRRRRKR